MIDIGNSLDESFLEKALEIANKQTIGLGSLIALIMSARILFVVAFKNNIDSHIENLKVFFLCSILLFCLGDIVKLLHSMPQVVLAESRGALKIAIPNEEMIEGYNYFLNLALISVYWVCIVIYYLAMFLLISIGPVVVVISFMFGSFGILKTYFTFIVAINIWPLGWHLVNVFTASIVNTFEILQNGLMSGVILFFSSFVKLAIPAFIYLLEKPLGHFLVKVSSKTLHYGSQQNYSATLRNVSKGGISRLNSGTVYYRKLSEYFYSNKSQLSLHRPKKTFRKTKREFYTSKQNKSEDIKFTNLL